MKIYLAGGVTGNLISFWKEAMKIYLAGIQSRTSFSGKAKSFVIGENKPLILESFFYLQKQNEWILKMKPFFGDFLLDSGAFTYMQGNGDKVNFEKYVREYAKFINKHKIDLFFELDIDIVVGIKEVERLRALLEKLTKKRCIPVWHKSRGKDYWLKMIKEYDYVAIGGIVSGEIKRKEAPIFRWFLETAKKENCKVHALGYTNLVGLTKYPFYSVDSTAWLYGNRGGFLYHFNGQSIKQIKIPNKRLLGKPAAIHNFSEWVKFQKYAELNL